MTYDKITIELTNYKKEFWNGMMKGIKGNYEDLKGGNIGNDMYYLMIVIKNTMILLIMNVYLEKLLPI